MMWLTNTRPTFAVAFAPDGDPADVGAVTATATDAAGTTIAGAAGTTGTGAAKIYTWTPDAPITDPTTIKIVWVRTATNETLTTFEEMVGSLLFSEAAARNYRVLTDLLPLADTARYSDLEIGRWRQAITELFEERTGRSWVTRHARVETAGSGRYDLPLAGGRACSADGAALYRPGRTLDAATLLAVTVDGDPVDLSTVKVGSGRLHRLDGIWPAATYSDPLNVIVEYAYGLPAPTAEATERALELLVANITRSDTPDNATSITTPEGNTYRITALPLTVDAFLKTHRFPMGIA